MNTLKSQLNYLNHILDECNFLISESESTTDEKFLIDDIKTRAFVRSIEIIGEATKNLSQDLKAQHQEIEWKKMAGMRDRLIHGYFKIDYELIWEIMINKIPKLKITIENIIKELQP